MARTNKIRRAAEDPLAKLERSIITDDKGNKFQFVPEAQAGKGLHIMVDAPSMQGEANRSGSKAQTLKRRRSTHIEMLLHRHTFTGIEALACEDYANMHAARHDTVGITAQWGGAPGARRTDYDHLPKTRPQKDAFSYLGRAQEALGDDLTFFEAVILHQHAVGREGDRLRKAARRLVDAMGIALNA